MIRFHQEIEERVEKVTPNFEDAAKDWVKNNLIIQTQLGHLQECLLPVNENGEFVKIDSQEANLVEGQNQKVAPVSVQLLRRWDEEKGIRKDLFADGINPAAIEPQVDAAFKLLSERADDLLNGLSTKPISGRNRYDNLIEMTDRQLAEAAANGSLREILYLQAENLVRKTTLRQLEDRALKIVNATYHNDDFSRQRHFFPFMREVASQLKRYQELRDEVEKSHFHIEQNRGDTDAIRVFRTRIIKLYKQIEDAAIDSPIIDLYARLENMVGAKKSLGSGMLVETAYVKEKIAQAMSSLAIGRPIFIHGELGAGKTEFGRHLARKYLSDPHLRRWLKAHPEPTEKTRGWYNWRAEYLKQQEPLFISGHERASTEEIAGGRTVERAQSLPPERQAEIVADAITNYKQSHPQATETEIKVLESAWIEAFRNPVEVRSFLSPLYQAMKEGRPVIVDEINAIPHRYLIILNDAITRKPGDTVNPPVPGEEPFVVQIGYNLIGTGNWRPEDQTTYVGRQPIDAASLSRWSLIFYDYLPNSKDGNFPDLDIARQENELFHLMILWMVDDDLTGKWPKDTVRSLFALSQAAKEIQNTFSGKNKTVTVQSGGIDRTLMGVDAVKENVLSIRHILPILSQWKNDGYTKPLEYYLFDLYIARSELRPTEQQYIYGVFQNNGFFQGNKWPSIDKLADIKGKTFLHDFDPVLGVPKLDFSTTTKDALEETDPVEIAELLWGRIAKIGSLKRKVRKTSQLTNEDQVASDTL